MDAFTESMYDNAKQAIKEPDSFAYFGDLDMFNTWGRSGISQNRDSKPLEQSNFAVITEDLLERFPDECQISSSNHWAVGWLEELYVQVYTDDTKSEITPVWEAVCEYQDKLADYPVIDEGDYSARELEDAIDTLKNCYNIPEDFTHLVISKLENVTDGDSISENEVDEIKTELADEITRDDYSETKENLKQWEENYDSLVKKIEDHKRGLITLDELIICV